jgi:phosphoglycerate dehydrogenase-like enzyme
MVRIAVLDDYAENAKHLADWDSIPGAEIVYFRDHVKEPKALKKMLQGFDYVQMMRERTPFPAEVLEGLPDLKVLGGTGGRHPHVDMEAANRLGITVNGTKGSSGVGGGGPTMELAWGLMIGLMRHIPWEDRQIREGKWQTRMGSGLGGKTLGIQGLGNIGTHMARMGNQFGMNVIAWGPTLDAERATKNGATYVSWDELYQQADVLTIHVPLTDLSRGWVTARELGMMKPTAVLINTSRGPIVDRDALLDALQTNKIAGAGIDVYDEEPIQEDNPFLKFDNVVLTPHLGYATIESLRNFYAGAVANINAWLGGEAINVLNEPVNVRGM